MEDLIITQSGTKDILKRIRSPKITIFNPESGDKSITFINNEATYIDNKLDSEKTIGVLKKNIDDSIMNEDIEYTDIVDGEKKTMKVAQMIMIIRDAYIKWYTESQNISDYEEGTEQDPINL